MTYYMYFIQTFIIRCIVSEILAEIDHKGPNWTFLTLKITFRVIPYLSYFRAGLVSQQKSYMMQINLGSTSLLLNNINNYGKMGLNLTFPTLKMTF